MKIDRLLGIVIYLLNRQQVNATTLAEKFEVSTRTIQRDIETLNMAGIPIVSMHGSTGGYGIIDGFKLEKQIANMEDYVYIITALKGMSTAYENKKLQSTIEKVISINGNREVIKNKMRVDLSVSREGSYVDTYLKILENGIDNRRRVEFEYTNSYGNKTVRKIEPIVVIHRWYAWYLLGYCCDKKDYRMFKVVRMRELKETEEMCINEHEDVDKILEEENSVDKRKYLDVKVMCKGDIRFSLEEYFPQGIVTELENEDFIMEFTLPDNERGWIGILMTYGNKIKILAPQELKERFISKAKEIYEIY